MARATQRSRTRIVIRRNTRRKIVRIRNRKR